MAKSWKVLDWFRDAKPEPQPDPAAIADAPPRVEEAPAFDLFPEESASGEKRSAQRRPLTVAGTMITGSFSTPDPVTVRDISRQGVYFFSSYKLASGQLAEITFTEPDSNEHVTYHVKIVRAEPAGENQFGVAARITRREILGK